MRSILTALLVAAGLALASTPAAAQKAEAPKDSAKETAKKPDAKKSDAKAGAATAAGTLIDINTASEQELATLPGIGEARAKAIVKGRPYRGKNELKDKKIVPESVYNGIQDKIIAKQKS